MVSLFLGCGLSLASLLLLEQCLVFGLKLGVDRRTPFRTDFPMQLVWATKCIPEAPPRLPANTPGN